MTTQPTASQPATSAKPRRDKVTELRTVLRKTQSALERRRQNAADQGLTVEATRLAAQVDAIELVLGEVDAVFDTRFMDTLAHARRELIAATALCRAWAAETDSDKRDSQVTRQAVQASQKASARLIDLLLGTTSDI